jgi:WD40 repeat protein
MSRIGGVKRRWPLGDIALLALIVAPLLAVLLVVCWRFVTKPKPAFVFPYDAGTAYEGVLLSDICFSSDGQSIAVLCRAANIYHVPDGKLLHSIPINERIMPYRGERKAAWNTSGTTFAVSSIDGQGCNVWDTKTWTVTRSLSLCVSAKLKDNIDVYVQALCWDRSGNLYMATDVLSDELTGGWLMKNPALAHPVVWWHDEHEPGCATPIGIAWEQCDLSAASVGRETLVAASYQQPSAFPVEILKVERQADGRPVVNKEYQIRKIKTARLRLSSDGAYLAAHDGDTFYLFQLLPRHEYKLILSRDAPLKMPGGALGPLKILDMSTDSRVVAYSSASRATVMHIPNGQVLLEVPNESKALALSPDGQLLAVPDLEKRLVCFYRIVSKANTENDSAAK